MVGLDIMQLGQLLPLLLPVTFITGGISSVAVVVQAGQMVVDDSNLGLVHHLSVGQVLGI